jgi:cell division septum initiation protein DivIVA
MCGTVHPTPCWKEESPINDINFLIERLEQLMNESWRIPMSSYLVVNEESLLDLVDQMRTAVPKQIRHAERVYQERDRILAQAEEEGARIVELAQGEAAKLVEEHDVIRAAAQRAQTIVERAQRDAEGLRSEADEYARGVLLALDEQLIALNERIASIMTIVRNGLGTLDEGRDQSQAE